MPWSRNVGYTFFLVILPLLLLSLQFLLYRILRRWMKEHLRAPRAARRIVAGLFLVFDLALVLALILRPDMRRFPEWFQIAGVFPFILWHASGFFLAFLLGLWALIAGGVKLFLRFLRLFRPVREKARTLAATPQYRRFDASRRTFLRRSAYVVAAASIGGTSYGMLVGKNQREVTTTEIPVYGLPNEFDGFVLAMVSDIHAGAFMLTRQMREYVSIVNDLGADLTVVPGDFVTGKVDEVYPFAEAFSELRAPHGVYGVLGNHDFYTGDPDRVAREVEKAGIHMLRDASVTIRRGSSSIVLAGVDDVGRNDRAPVKLYKALASVPKGSATVLLCHRPYYLPQAAARDVGLMLSGHTHGGQIVLGRFGNAVLTPAAFASPYIWGLYTSRNTRMYITRGIGTVGLPMRINCPAEISKIVLRPA